VANVSALAIPVRGGQLARRDFDVDMMGTVQPGERRDARTWKLQPRPPQIVTIASVSGR